MRTGRPKQPLTLGDKEKLELLARRPKTAQRAAMREAFLGAYDVKLGGWGDVHKYLNWDALEYCLTEGASGDERMRGMARQTLTSGLRLVSAATTTAGRGPDQMRTVGALIGRALRGRDDEGALDRVRGEVLELCTAFPPYPTLAPA